MRSLNTDEALLWQRVMASVRPLRAAVVPARPAPVPVEAETLPTPGAPKVRGRVPPVRQPVVVAPPVRKGPGETLDGGWDKRLTRGAVIPDSSIDLHGHTLASAHAMLDRGLERAIGRGDRLLLLVTGKPPRPESERPHARGAIRAAIADWLAGSRHADHIAAVRGAHPRHGGQGALYIVIRRPRER